MSHNQSRAEKTEGRLRRPGRSGSFGQNRGFSGGGKGGGASAPVPALLSSVASAPSSTDHALSTDRSSKKSGNGQGELTRENPGSSNSDAAHRAVPNGTYTINLSHGPSDGLESNSAKPVDSFSNKKIPRAVPKAPAAQSAASTPGNESGPFVQFGTINPGIMNGMQVPARTCSAPPNLDEQKQDQAHHSSVRVAPALPIPSAPKLQQVLQKPPLQQNQQQTVKDVGCVNQAVNRESHPPIHPKRDMHVPIPSIPSATPPRTSVITFGGMQMRVPFQQPKIPVQFSGPNLQMTSQGIAPSSLQMTMSRNLAQVPQPMFVSNIQSHPLQPPAIMHQGQSLGFAPQFGHQLPPQLGSLGVGIAPQFHQQQPGNFLSQRKAVNVKITHPETHEELKLDRRTDLHSDACSSGQRQLPNATSQSQSLPSFNHQISYYPTNYNPSPMFFTNHPLSLSSINHQTAKFSYTVGQNGQTIPLMNPTILNAAPGPPPPLHGLSEAVSSEVSSVSVSLAAPAQVTLKPAILLPSEKNAVPSVRISMPISKAESTNQSKLPGDVSVTQSKNKEVGSQNTAAIQKKIDELHIADSSFSATDKNLTRVSTMVPVPITKSEASSLDPIVGSAVSNCSDLVTVSGDGLSFEEAGHFETSTSSTDVDGIIFGTCGISIDSCKTLEAEQIHENSTECRRDKSSDTDLLGNSSAIPVSTSIGSSDETDGIVILKVENKAVSQLCDSDELHLEEGGSYSEIVKAAVVSKDTEFAPCDQVLFTDAKISGTDSTIDKCEITHSENVAVSVPPEISPRPSSSEMRHKPKVKTVELPTGAQTLSVLSGSLGKPSLETDRTNTNKKKKRREILSKADAAGSSDLYNAYKGPDEKPDTISTSETIESSSPANSKNDTVEDHSDVDVTADEVDKQSKAEIEDWEDAADASSTPKLRSVNGELVHVKKKAHVEDGNESTGKKKYSRDVLLSFSEQCKDLPEGFEVGPDIRDILICVQSGTARGIDRDTLPSPGRIIDRSSGASRVGVSDDDRWMKGSNPFRMDLSHGVTSMNLRPGQGVNHGVLRNPRLQSNQLAGGILSGPMQSSASQGGTARNSSDADRWQRANGTQRGLMPPPQGSMHKSANKYEVGKVSDEEEQKQRQLKAILNKLTPQNFEKLFAQVKEVNIDNKVTLTGVISQIFDKALMEPTFCEMYADFCHHLAGELPDFGEDNEKVTFRRLLLNKCQEEFERGEREEAEADKVEEEGEIRPSEAEREEKRINARRRMLGNIRLIGELYKKKMLTEKIMHECIKKLLGNNYQNPDEEDIEALCKLMSTIGEMIDHSKARELMDAYFDMMAKLSTNQKLSSRLRFMLKDTIDLRKNKWQQRRKVEGPKKIEDVHRDAAQERQAQTTRSARAPISSSKRGPPLADYGHRGSTIVNNTSSSQASGRQLRGGPGSQDVRFDDRGQFLSGPLPQRPTDGSSITLGPQGGLAKGMSGRGQGGGPNGFSSSHDRIPSTSRVATSGRRPDSSGGKINPSEPKPLSEETLREKSKSAILEFYRIKDEKEVVALIRELKNPSFYPSMISLWVSDSLERKSKDRCLLAELLVKLSNGRDCLFSPSQLIQGFETVLSTLEDAVNDAPKAAEFVGQFFGELVVENILLLTEIGNLIRDGGEQTGGGLMQTGLGSEILGCVLEFVKEKKGDSFLNEMRISSKLRFEEFKPSDTTSTKLDAFL